jgi:hypothetical protein
MGTKVVSKCRDVLRVRPRDTLILPKDPVHQRFAPFATILGCADSRLSPDEDERLELVHLPIADAVAMVEAGEISDAKTILGVLWVDRLARTGEL